MQFCDFSFRVAVKFEPKLGWILIQSVSLFSVEKLRWSELQVFGHRQQASHYSLGWNVSHSTLCPPGGAVLQRSADIISLDLLYELVVHSCITPKHFAYTLSQFYDYCCPVCIPIKTVSFLMGVEEKCWCLIHFSIFRGECGFLAIKKKKSSIDDCQIELKLLECTEISLEECFTASNSKSYSWRRALLFKSNPVLRFVFAYLKHEYDKNQK